MTDSPEPHEERLGRAEADRLIAASLDLSGLADPAVAGGLLMLVALA